MTIKCRKVVMFMEEIAPKHLAEDWDNVGLIIGDFEKDIKHILVCLDITSPIVEYAENKNVDMIISHHPLIFKPIKSICIHNWKENLISRLIKKNICVYCAHTNLDYAEEGVNRYLAQAIGLTKIKNYITKSMDKPNDIICDIYPNELKRDVYGIGKMGVLLPPQDLTEFIDNIKNALRTRSIKLIGNIDKKINKVAVFSGSFDDRILNTITSIADIDILITGDIKYHTAIEILEMGMCVIDAGHFGTENIIVPQIINWLKKRFPGIVISCNTMETEPFKYY
jgi:dinuclear metal center YbgI/SA1388 family protein